MLVFSPIQVYLLSQILLNFYCINTGYLIKCIIYRKTILIFVERIEVAQPKGKN